MVRPVDASIRVGREEPLSPLSEQEAERREHIRSLIDRIDQVESASRIRFEHQTHKIVCSAVASKCLQHISVFRCFPVR